jgi:type I restriction enzyme S subunit
VRNHAWTWTPIDKLFEIGAGKTMTATARSGVEQRPFLRTSNVLWSEFDLSTIDHMSMSDEELADKGLLPRDLLVCEGGEIGRAAVWNEQLAGVSFQNHLHRLRALTSDVVPEFYAYFLQSAFTQLGVFQGAGNETTIPNLSRNRLGALEVPSPVKSQHLEIVRVLDRVREGIRANVHAATVASTLKLAAMRELFTRGLRGEEQKETEIGPLPGGWGVMALGDLGRVGNGSTPKRSVPAYWEGGTFPWLTSAKVYDREIVAADQFVTEIALSECHLPKVKPGSVLMAITGQGKTLGHCAVLRLEATVNQHIAYINVAPEKADPSYVRGYLETQYDYLRQVGSGGGSTKGALTCAFLKAMPIPLPPQLAEQREIVEILDAIDQKIDLHKRKKAVLEELFKALLHKLMTGEIRVADLDLSALDAPAATVARP